MKKIVLLLLVMAHMGSAFLTRGANNLSIIKDEVSLTMNPVGKNDLNHLDRRSAWNTASEKIRAWAILQGLTVPLSFPCAALAEKSRSEGYTIQKTNEEWKQQLSSMQYYVLREGGTERPGYSVLESEKREGTFECAGCGTPLFESKYKFTSGTGWPSFARALPGVEIEKVNTVQATLTGAELRCATCGGHLGDVFQDGYLFLGTEAQKSGERYCIDGAALVFMPVTEEEPVRGDVKAKPKPTPSWLEPPQITPKV